MWIGKDIEIVNQLGREIDAYLLKGVLTIDMRKAKPPVRITLEPCTEKPFKSGLDLKADIRKSIPPQPWHLPVM